MTNKWIIGSRPRTLPAAIAPVLVGTALAGTHWQPLRAAMALAVSLLLQIGVNYANDYSDGIRGTDSNRLGPTRLTASGLASAAAVKRAALLSFALASLFGLGLASLTSWWLIPVGLVAIVAAWGYTGGKNPYGYLGLGEVSVFVFFGVVATVGSYFVQVEKVTLVSFIASIPMGTLACAILVINNIRDRAQDAIVGKKTLAVRLGDRSARYFYLLLLISAHIFAIAAARQWGLLTLIALPLTINLARKITTDIHGVQLAPLLAKTGQLQLVFAVCFSLGLLFLV